MIRATLSLALVGLAGVVAVWWTARYLDPLRVVERIAPAQVRTVDLSGSRAFPRPRSEAPRAEDAAPAPAPGPREPAPAAAAPVEAASAPPKPVAGDAVTPVAQEPAAEPREAASAPESPPADPDASAELIRRMLSLYPRRGDSE